MFLAGFKLKLRERVVVQLKRGSPRVQGSCARDIGAFLLLFSLLLFFFLSLFAQITQSLSLMSDSTNIWYVYINFYSLLPLLHKMIPSKNSAILTISAPELSGSPVP